MNKLQRISNPEIHDVLKTSYDGLDEEEKNIFLDIACFFKGEDIDFATKLLDGCYFSLDSGLTVLVDKSLITINSKHELQMHDLLQEMGWEIVRKESKEPGERSRLWNHDDVYHVLKNKTETNAIEGIFLDVSEIGGVLYLDTGAFVKMCNLRYLKLYASKYFEDFSKVHLPHGLEYLSGKLRYLHWPQYPLRTLPSNFCPKNLVQLDMPDSYVEQLWCGTQNALQLKSIDLCHSRNLIHLPDLTKATNLQDMNLDYCTSLLHIPSSIQYLDNLTTLSLKGFKSLENFPSGIHCGSLVSLDLSHCIRVTKFPQISLNLQGTAIEEVPSSIQLLTKLVDLTLKNCTSLKDLPTSICKLKSLFSLDLGCCSKLESFPEILEQMESLRYLQLGGTAIKGLPSSIENLIGLVQLYLTRCKNLETLPSSFSKLTSLHECAISCWPKNFDEVANAESSAALSQRRCSGFSALVLPPLSGLCSLKELSLTCCNLTKIPEDLGCLPSLESLDLSGSNFESIPASIKQLSKLERLYFCDYNMLQKLPELPVCVRYLEANRCKRLLSLPKVLPFLKQLDTSKLKSMRIACVNFWFINCLKLNQISQILFQHMVTAVCYVANFFADCAKEYPVTLKRYTAEINMCLPGSEVPEWFSYGSSGSLVTIQLPRHLLNSNFMGFALCAVIAFEEHSDVRGYISVRSSGLLVPTCELKIPGKGVRKSIDSDHICFGFTRCSYNLLKSDYNVSFEFCPMDFDHNPIQFIKVKYCGVSPLYAHPIEEFSAINQDFKDLEYQNETNTSGSSDEEEVEPYVVEEYQDEWEEVEPYVVE